jgi:4-amino-4-deoxy-L-arabinose transferase-like glycosyltransferase
LAAVPLALVFSLPALLWFAGHWSVFGNDSGRYLLTASELVSGRALEGLHGISGFNGGHGPVFPALIGALMAVFGRDTEELVWGMRLAALLNPLLAYLLTKRLSNTVGGLVAAALVAMLGYDADSSIALSIDPILLAFYLLALVALVAAVERDGAALALLSGALLGTAILTKETAVANAPLALLAVLLLDCRPRGALWHYVGLVLVCLPWWAWAWSATGDVYLLDRLPAPLEGPVLVAGATISVLVVVAYATGLVDRFLASERRRRWGGWSVAIAWTGALSGMLLATAGHALEEVNLGDARAYLANVVLSPPGVILPMLVAVVGYACWRARGRGAPMAWRLLALALLFQAPVCLLITVEHWLPRQFLVPQALVFCALAALLAEAGAAAADRARGRPARLAGALVACALTGVVLVACVGRARALLPEDPAGVLSGQDKVPPQEARMVRWMDENVPEGERILVVAEPLINKEQAYVMFLDGRRHEWTKLHLDQGLCEPRPNVQMGCDLAKNGISGIPPDAIWVQQMTGKMGACKFMSLSMPTLLEQARREGSEYVLIVGPLEPRYARLPSPLMRSGAYRVARAEFPEGKEWAGTRGVVLLKRTGSAPKELPTQMTASTARTLERCERALGRDPAERLKSLFPNGILEVPG